MARRRGRGVGVLALFAILAGAAWFFRGHIPGLGAREEVVSQVSPEAAKQAQEKLARMRESGDTVHMTDVEFTSLLRYDLAGLTGPLRDPSVEFVDNTLKLSGRVPTDLLPRSPELEQMASFIPDTADVTVSGSMRTLRPGHAALNVQDVSFARFPIPASYYPQVIDRLGRSQEPGLQPQELHFTLPPGVAEVAVEGGELILTPAKQ